MFKNGYSGSDLYLLFMVAVIISCDLISKFSTEVVQFGTDVIVWCGMGHYELKREHFSPLVSQHKGP